MAVLVGTTLAIAIAAGLPEVDIDPAAVTTIVETSTTDFASGTLTGVMITEVDNGATGGQFRLQPLLNDLFLTPDLDPQWHITRPAGGYTPVIENGILDVQERDDSVFETSAIESWSTYTAGVVCEVRAMFLPGSAFVNVGFTSSTASTGQWAFFSTRGSGDSLVPVIMTSLCTASGRAPDVPTTATFGEWHVFKIVWISGIVGYYVDDVVVDVRTAVDITLPQRVGLYKSDASDSPLFVDWVRVTPYTESPGGYESQVLDAQAADTPWTVLDWDGVTPTGTSVTFETRTGETPSPDAGWSPWATVVGADITSPSGRYAQYRAILATYDLPTGPVVDEVRLSYTYPDVAPPVVVGTVPPEGGSGVPIGALITATFSEAIDPATLSTSSFTVTPAGGSAVAATVSYDAAGFVARLTPDTPLAYATGYEARLTTAITDLEANPLAEDHVWSFTTMPQDLTPPVVVVTVPAAGADSVLAGRFVTATFSEAIDPATVTNASFTVTPEGGAPVAAAVTYDPLGFRAILDPTVELDWATLHEARLTTAVTDLAGNPLAVDEVWSFRTRYEAPVTKTATTTAHFSAGVSSGVMVTEIDSSSAGGQLRLQGRLNDLFLEPILGPQWHATNPEGYQPVIENGILDVQERDDDIYTLSSIESHEAWGPNVVFEARAMFVPGSRFIDVGFDASTYHNGQYAWFSTAGTSHSPGEERIFARYREYDHNTVEIETAITFNEWHVFKVVWTPGHIEYYADGVLVATASDVVFTMPMRAAFYKTAYSGTPFYIDWVRVTPYTGDSGTYDSPVADAGGEGAGWIDLEWSGLQPDGTNVVFATRTGETPAPDGDWSAWSPLNGFDITSPPGRYAQYRVELTTADHVTSPVIDAVHISHAAQVDSVAPEVLATSPEAEATAVPVEIVVTATLDEPIDPATLTTDSFTLVPEGGTSIPATVNLDLTGATATLTPHEQLELATTYEARLTTAVTDNAGNALAEDYHWIFTTATTTIDVGNEQIPAVTQLLPAVPNPFNPMTTVSFELARTQSVTVSVYSVGGRLIRTLVSGEMAAGHHSAVWYGTDDSGRKVPTGVYLLRLETRDAVLARKLLLVK